MNELPQLPGFCPMGSLGRGERQKSLKFFPNSTSDTSLLNFPLMITYNRVQHLRNWRVESISSSDS